MSEEHVLVVPESRLQAFGMFSGFRPFCPDAFELLLNPEFMQFRPRSTVEEDPTFKQLIPYLILEAERDGQRCIFQYTRGSGQGESRLHAKRSIGIGGHIAREDADGQDLYRSGMLRELSEEMVVDSPYEEELVGFIFDDTSAVGRVHLGVVHRLTLQSPNASAREIDLVESGFEEVAMMKENLDDFETWSQLCLRNLYEAQLPGGATSMPLIYLDNHATTPLDPVALDAMLLLMREHFANAGSSHAAGREVAELVDRSIALMAASLGADADELIITSGATESNNLALFGSCLHPRQPRRKVVSVVSEHKAILDPLARLEKQGFEVVLVPVQGRHSSAPGRVDLEQLAGHVDSDTALVSVMLANNEIGTMQPLGEIARLCREVGCLLHSDASQAVGRMAVDVDALDVDLLSFSAHKFYGPKGVGGLYVRGRGRRVKLQAQIVGGGQQHNFRSGTLNTAGIVGMQAALTSSLAGLASDLPRIVALRDRLWTLLREALDFVTLNGPSLDADALAGSRLCGNLNCSFYPLEGQSLMLETPHLAISSGSACTTAQATPSHVLQAIGLSEEQARSSLRFGIGRFNTQADIEQAAQWLIAAAGKLQQLL